MLLFRTADCGECTAVEMNDRVYDRNFIFARKNVYICSNIILQSFMIHQIIRHTIVASKKRDCLQNLINPRPNVASIHNYR